MPATVKRALVAILVASAVAGCGSPSPISTQTPIATGGQQSREPSQQPTSSTGPGPTDPAGTPVATEPGASPVPTQQEPLPEPTLTDGFSIGSALYDPGLAGTAVASLLSEMGVAIYSSDGMLLRAGEDRGWGELSLTDRDAMGWIDITLAELAAATDFAGTATVADLHAALATSLPGTTLTDFAAAYDEAYASEPDSFAAQVMLGQPISPDTRLLRIHLWLLLVDGFGATGTSSARPATPSTGLARVGQTMATAISYLPPLRSPVPRLTSSEWFELLTYLPTLPYNVDFRVQQSADAHEGHHRLGDPVTFTSQYDLLSADLISRRTGKELLFARSLFNPLPLTWNSADRATLDEHGTLSAQLGARIVSNAGGASTISYTPKREDTDGQGDYVYEMASLFAEADAYELFTVGYVHDSDVDPAARALIQGTIRSDPQVVKVSWHDDDYIKLKLSNPYDFMLSVAAGIEILTLSRFGTDSVEGTLTRYRDGTYRGTLNGETDGTADGTMQTTLVGAECHDHQAGTQLIYVVATLEVGLPAPDPTLYRLTSGSYAEEGLNLSFYPASAPLGNSTLCQPFIPFAGGGPDGRPAGTYLPFNDTRWSTPEVGYFVYLPLDDPSANDENLVYKDIAQYNVSGPGGNGLPGVVSKTWWDIDITLHQPEP